MATAPQNDVLLLGAGGKLGRMVRAAWPVVSDRRLVPVTRGAGDGALRWVPGTPHGDLPRVGAVVALWGVTGRAPDALAMNSYLAEQAQSLAIALGATRVIHCSSAAVYAPADTPVSEVTDLAPFTPYGQAKLAMERRLAELSDAQIATTVLRIGNVAGAESLFANMRPGGCVTLDRFPSGRGPWRSYIGPTDLARVIAAMLEAPAAAVDRIFNVGAPAPVCMDDIARAAGCHVDWRPAPDTATERLVLDTARLGEICPLPMSSADPACIAEDARTGGIWP